MGKAPITAVVVVVTAGTGNTLSAPETPPPPPSPILNIRRVSNILRRGRLTVLKELVQVHAGT